MTLIVAVPFKTGLVVGSDRRAMRGTTIHNDATTKLLLGPNWIVGHHGYRQLPNRHGVPVDVMNEVWSSLRDKHLSLDMVTAEVCDVLDRHGIATRGDATGFASFGEPSPGDFWYSHVTSKGFGAGRAVLKGRCEGIAWFGEVWPLHRLVNGYDPEFATGGAGLTLRPDAMSGHDAVALARGLLYSAHLATNYFSDRSDGQKVLQVIPVVGDSFDLAGLENGCAISA